MLKFIKYFYKKEAPTPRIRQLTNGKWICLVLRGGKYWGALDSSMSGAKTSWFAPDNILQYAVFDSEYDAAQAYAHYLKPKLSLKDEIKKYQNEG